MQEKGESVEKGESNIIHPWRNSAPFGRLDVVLEGVLPVCVRVCFPIAVDVLCVCMLMRVWKKMRGKGGFV